MNNTTNERENMKKKKNYSECDVREVFFCTIRLYSVKKLRTSLGQNN